MGNEVFMEMRHWYQDERSTHCLVLSKIMGQKLEDVSEVHQHQLFYESIVNSSAQVVRSDAIKRSCSNIQALRCRTSASRPPRLSGGAHSWRDSPRCRQGRARPGSV
ncbi:Protein of unknown function [Gryllus bimaculatus]|nr:Protein of unknown function [Gryllus bimaculatus]